MKLHRIGYVKHQESGGGGNKSGMNHMFATGNVGLHHSSMLDLSLLNRPSSHLAHASQPYGASRSRHSLALLSHLPSGGGSNDPRASFRKRPPSVASYHHLINSHGSSASAAIKNARYPQYLFGAKSELSLLNTQNYFNFSPTSGDSTNSGTSSKNINRKLSQTETEMAMKHHQQQQMQQQSPSNRNFKQKDQSGIGVRSSFRRRSNIRKSGSDASAFYNRRNLMKRSQIAQNQLSSILYNNFCSKKLVPGVFGSQTTLLEDSQHQATTPETELSSSHFSQASLQSPFSPLQNLSSRHLNYDFSQQLPFSGAHVYLPTPVTQTGFGLAHRSNSCQMLNIENGGGGQYHNHLMHKTPKNRQSKFPIIFPSSIL